MKTANRTARVKSATRVSQANPAKQPVKTWSRRRAMCWLANIQLTIDLAHDAVRLGRNESSGDVLTEGEREAFAEILEAAQVAIAKPTPTHDDNYAPRSI